MKPKRIFLIRHTESEGNLDPDTYSKKPDYQISLSEQGHRDAIELGQRLSPLLVGSRAVQFYLSPYLRVKQTFEGMLKGMRHLRYRVTEDPQLREHEAEMFPKADTRDKAIRQSFSYGPFFFRFQQGESSGDVYDRVSGFLSSIWRHFQDDDYPENVVIVSHGGTMRIFLMRWFHLDQVTVHELHGIQNGIILTLELNQETDRYEMREEDRIRIGLNNKAGAWIIHDE